MKASPRMQLGGLLSTVALQNVAYTILIPFVPALRDDFAMTPAMVGLAFAGFTAAKAAVQPFGGWAADRYSPRLVAVIGLLVCAAGTAGLAWAHSGTDVVTLRLLWGFGEGLAMPALYRLVSDLGRRSGQDPGKAMGWFGSAAVLGMTAGPGLVAALSDVLTFSRAFLLGGALTAASAILLLAVFPRWTAEPERPRAAPAARAGSRRSLLTFGAVIGGLGLLDLLNNFIYSALEPILPLFVHDRFDADGRAISVVIFCGLLIFAVFAPVAGRIAGAHPPLRVAAVALSVQVLALAVPAVVGTLTAFIVGFLLLMSMQPVVYVCVRTGLALTGGTNQGKAFGWFGLISDIGWVLGPLVATGLLTVWASGVFFLLAGAAVLGIGVALRLVDATRPQDTDSPVEHGSGRPSASGTSI